MPDRMPHLYQGPAPSSSSPIWAPLLVLSCGERLLRGTTGYGRTIAGEVEYDL
jgi:hypothetical protein